MGNIWIYIAVMAAVSFAIRTLPVMLLKKPIKSRFIRSFLYYVPYVTLSVMTFPAIMNASGDPVFGLVSMLCGILLAWMGAGLFTVAVSCCAVVFVLQLIF